jgi:hypothetical protein
METQSVFSPEMVKIPKFQNLKVKIKPMRKHSIEKKSSVSNFSKNKQK